jgi:hypothetical protein
MSRREAETVPPWTYLSLQNTIALFASDLRKPGNGKDIVWHYTNAAGLIGILESGHFWGTNYAFMNDASEIEYGRGLARQVLDALQAAGSGASFFSRMGEKLQQFTEDSEIYLACFSELGNDLSQWRGYSSGPDRFSLGVATGALHEREPGAIMRAVEYERAKQESEIREFLRQAWAVVEGEESHAVEDAAATMLVPFLFDILCFYKDEQFSAEKEWRIAKRLNTAELSEVGFSDSSTGLRAYLPLCAAPRATSLPLVEVNYLSAHPDRARKFAKMLLRKCGYLNVEVTRSNIPFVL